MYLNSLPQGVSPRDHTASLIEPYGKVTLQLQQYIAELPRKIHRLLIWRPKVEIKQSLRVEEDRCTVQYLIPDEALSRTQKGKGPPGNTGGTESTSVNKRKLREQLVYFDIWRARQTHRQLLLERFCHNLTDDARAESCEKSAEQGLRAREVGRPVRVQTEGFDGRRP